MVGWMAARKDLKAYCWAAMKGLWTAASMDQRLVGSLGSRMAASMAATKDSKAYYWVAMMAPWTAASTDLDLVVTSGDQKVEPKAAKMVVTVTNSVGRKVELSVGSRDKR